MNEQSSRSHSIFMINVKQKNMDTQKELDGKIYLVDLAGSETVAKTGATGIKFEEAKKINKSLSALGNVIAKLSSGDKNAHIPYRDSKLTRILQESLGGNSKTTIIICCSPAAFNESETISTLEFGKRAKKITNVVCANETLTAEEWKKRYEKERERNEILRTRNKKMETELKKWRNGQTVSSEEQFNLEEIEVDTSLLDVPQPKLNRISGEFSFDPSAISAEDQKKIMDEQDALYQMLDEKDVEIQEQSSLVAKLKEQVFEQELLISATRGDYDKITKQMANVQGEYDLAKGEVKEVLKALEDLAVDYEKKFKEAETKTIEYNEVLFDLGQQQSKLNFSEIELNSYKDALAEEKKKTSVMMQNLLSDLEDIGTKMANNQIELKSYKEALANEKKNSAEMLKSLLSDLEEVGTAIANSHKKSGSENDQKAEEDFQVAKDLISKMKSNTEIQVSTAEENPVDISIASTRTKIIVTSPSEEKVEAVQEEVSEEFTMARLLLSKIKSDGDTETNLEEPNSSDFKERARQNINGVEETVLKELQTLHNLRRMFVQDLEVRIKKTKMGEELDDAGGMLAKKQKIIFLEKNLEQLTKVHKEAVRDNADLRCEVPKLEKRLLATMARVKVN